MKEIRLSNEKVSIFKIMGNLGRIVCGNYIMKMALRGGYLGNGWILHLRRMFGLSSLLPSSVGVCWFHKSLADSTIKKRVWVYQNNQGGQYGLSNLKRSNVGKASNRLHVGSVTRVTSDIELFGIEFWSNCRNELPNSKITPTMHLPTDDLP